MVLYLGVDIGGTKTALCLGTPEGVIVARRRRPTAASGDALADVASLVADARALLAEAGASAVARVGVSAPGPLDPARRRILGPPNLPGWSDVPLAARLEDAFGTPVNLENDANAAALAEWRHGAGRGRRNLVYLTMSTGIGGGIVADGALVRGGGGLAGEIGHVPVVWDGVECACGQRGCLEAYLGGAAWTRHLRATAPASSAAVARAGGRHALRPEHVVAAAGEGDAFSRRALAHYTALLARGLVGLAFTLAPELIVLGTIPTAAGDALCLDPLRRQVRARLWPALAARLEIAPAALGEELPYRAGLCAAAEGADA